MMCSHMPETTRPIANPENPLTKPPKNVARIKRSKRLPSMLLAPKESEQRLHGVTHFTGRLRRPRAILYRHRLRIGNVIASEAKQSRVMGGTLDCFVQKLGQNMPRDRLRSSSPAKAGD